MQELPRVHLPPHCGIKPLVAQRTPDILKTHSVWREYPVNYLVVLIHLLGVLHGVSQYLSQLRPKVPIQVFSLGELLVGTARHIGTFTPVLDYLSLQAVLFSFGIFPLQLALVLFFSLRRSRK